MLVNTLVGVVLIGVSIGGNLTRQRSRWWTGLALLPLLAAGGKLLLAQPGDVAPAVGSAVNEDDTRAIMRISFG